MYFVARSGNKRRRRLRKEATAAARTHSQDPILPELPDELWLLVFAYTGRRDVAVLCRVCARFRQVMYGSSATELWRELTIRNCGSIVSEVWRSLRGKVRNDHDEPLDDVALWRRIFESRKGVCAQRILEEGVDYHSVASQGLPAFDPFTLAWPDWMKPVNHYAFTVHVWNVDGKKLSRTVHQAVSFGSTIHLDLGRFSTVGNLILSGDFNALEIEMGSADPTGAVSAVLYSSFNPLTAYGGGSFEEYSAMPWFEWEGYYLQQDHTVERHDWLPFVSASTISTCVQFDRSITTVMTVAMQWRCRTATGKRGDKYDFVHWMNQTDILTLLKHRSRTRGSSSGEDPQCFVESVGPVLPTRDYTPKPMNAYSFLVEMENTKDPAKNCSIFFERPSEFDDDMGLGFDLLVRYEDFLPWGEDYSRDGEESVWVDIDIIFTVFVIDRRTGMQAKLYESKSCCTLFEYFDLSHLVEFEKCASLTQFSNGSEVDSIPVPSTRGFLPNAWRGQREVYGDGGTTSFYVQFEFLCYKAGNPGTGAAIETHDSTCDDFLVFLDKGLVYN